MPGIFRTALFLCSVLIVFGISISESDARPRGKHARGSFATITCDQRGCGDAAGVRFDPGVSYRAGRTSGRHAGLGPRPRMWCGWWLRQRTGRLDPSLNLARAWLKFPRTSARPGAIVVWARGKRGGHVGQIVQVTGRCSALVISGNDGRAVRTRERNICNALGIVS